MATPGAHSHPSRAHALPGPGMTLQPLLLARGQAPSVPQTSSQSPSQLPAFPGVPKTHTLGLPAQGWSGESPGTMIQGAACSLLEEVGSPTREAGVHIQGLTPPPWAARSSWAFVSSPPAGRPLKTPSTPARQPSGSFKWETQCLFTPATLYRPGHCSGSAEDRLGHLSPLPHLHNLDKPCLL